MYYAMSDLHGCYEKYKAMLDAISFTSKDTLFIIGDVIDRGKDGVKLLQEIMERPNIKLLMGNHEYLMATLLSNIEIPITSKTVLSAQMLEGLHLWFADGGQDTFAAFLSLSGADQIKIMRYLRGLPLYAQPLPPDYDFILTHSGFDYFSPDRTLRSYGADELLFHRHSIDENYFSDVFTVVGHTPTFDYGAQYMGKIIQNGTTFYIDCGCSYERSGVLGCLRLDDLTEFYVQ